MKINALHENFHEFSRSEKMKKSHLSMDNIFTKFGEKDYFFKKRLFLITYE